MLMDNPLQENAIANLWDLAGGEAEIVRELVSDYATMAKDVIATIEGALEASDARGAEHAAHSLKGSSAMMGAQLVREASEAIERAAAAGDLAAARAHLPGLHAAQEATLVRLRAACDEPAPGA
jgi:HPt (histidine-containing phosphotransfer) domain-containing protein